MLHGNATYWYPDGESQLKGKVSPPNQGDTQLFLLAVLCSISEADGCSGSMGICSWRIFMARVWKRTMGSGAARSDLTKQRQSACRRSRWCRTLTKNGYELLALIRLQGGNRAARQERKRRETG